MEDSCFPRSPTEADTRSGDRLSGFFIFLISATIFLSSSIIFFFKSPSPIFISNSRWKSVSIHRNFSRTFLDFQISSPPNWQVIESDSGISFQSSDTSSPLLNINWYNPDILYNRAYAPCDDRQCQFISRFNSVDGTTFTVWKHLPDKPRYPGYPPSTLEINLNNPKTKVEFDILSFSLPLPTLRQVLSTFRLSPSPTPQSEGEFCGGIAGLACPTGFTCQLDGNYPDAGGTCIKNPTKTRCKIGGCSSELCLDADSPDMVSICIYKDEYACLKYSVCARQSSGQCAWTQTQEYQTCIAKLRH